MMWAGISFRHRTPLVVIDGNLNAERYVDEILEAHVVPFFENNADLRFFQQDNARPHSARVSCEYLHSEGVAVLPWPAFPLTSAL